MKKINAIKAALIMCGLTMASVTLAAGPSAEALAYTCAGCHGTNGQSHGPASPTLAGMSKPVMVATMKGFKSGDIASTIMGRIAKGYSEEQFEMMGEFFAEQPFTAAEQPSDAALAKTGAKLHDMYCEKCHSDGGSVKSAVEDEVGVLSGQWTPYLHYTLSDFVSGARPMPKKMKKKLDKLFKKQGDDGLKALLEYYAGNK